MQTRALLHRLAGLRWTSPLPPPARHVHRHDPALTPLPLRQEYCGRARRGRCQNEGIVLEAFGILSQAFVLVICLTFVAAVLAKDVTCALLGISMS